MFQLHCHSLTSEPNYPLRQRFYCIVRNNFSTGSQPLLTSDWWVVFFRFTDSSYRRFLTQPVLALSIDCFIGCVVCSCDRLHSPSCCINCLTFSTAFLVPTGERLFSFVAFLNSSHCNTLIDTPTHFYPCIWFIHNYLRMIPKIYIKFFVLNFRNIFLLFF